MPYRWNPIRFFHWFCLELLAGALLGYFVALMLGWVPSNAQRDPRVVAIVEDGPVGPPDSPVDATTPGDEDDDGLPDSWEIANHHDPANPDDAESDFDLDGLTALEEYRNGKSALGQWDLESFPVPSAVSGWASYPKVNRNGLVMVTFTSPSASDKVYLLDSNSGTWTDITPVHSGDVAGNDINDNGDVAMTLWSGSSFTGIIRHANGSIMELEDPQGDPARAFDLNNSGDWVGKALFGGSVSSVGGNLFELDTGTGAPFYVAINEWGEILGGYMTTDGGWGAFVEYGFDTFGIGEASDYPFWLPSASPVLNEMAALNNYGEFAGIASKGGDHRTYLFDGKFHSWNVGGDDLVADVSAIDDDARVIVEPDGGSLAFGGLCSDGVAVPLEALFGPSMGAVLETHMSANGIIVLGATGGGAVRVAKSDQDQDEDGMSDDWEDIQGLNKNLATDANSDPDGDGVTNLGEFYLGTNPNAAPVFDFNGIEIDLRPGVDTDGDGMPNVWEWQNGLDYDNPDDASADNDHDGTVNWREFKLGTDPRGRAMYGIQEVSPLSGISSASPNTASLSGGDVPGVSMMVMPSSLTGGRPGMWRRYESGQNPTFEIYPSHGVPNSTTSLASSGHGRVASYGTDPATVIFWPSYTNTPSVQLGGTSQANIKTISNCTLSSTSQYLAGWRTLQSTGASQAFLWRMPSENEIELNTQISPVQLTLPAGYTLTTGTKIYVNDSGYAAATGKNSSGVAAGLLWKVDPGGTSVTSTILAPLGTNKAMSVVGLSDYSVENPGSGNPVVFGSATNASNVEKSVVWNASGVASEIVGGSSASKLTCSVGSVVAGTIPVVVGGVTKQQTFTAKYHAATAISPAGWRVMKHGDPVQSVTHSQVTEFGEVIGAVVSSTPSVHTIWRQGRSFGLKEMILEKTGYQISSYLEMGVDGVILATAYRNGAYVNVVLIPEKDVDADGIADSYETANQDNPLSAAAENTDSDGDGLTDAEEYRRGTNLHDEDSDQDGMPDKWEIDNGLDPLDPADAFQDPDGDLVTNIREYKIGTEPFGFYKLETYPLGSEGVLDVVGNDGSFIMKTPYFDPESGTSTVSSGFGFDYTFVEASQGSNPRETKVLAPDGYYYEHDVPQTWYRNDHTIMSYGIADGVPISYRRFTSTLTTSIQTLTIEQYSVVADWLAAVPVDVSFIEMGVRYSLEVEPAPANFSSGHQRFLLWDNTNSESILLDQNGMDVGPSGDPIPYGIGLWTHLNDKGHLFRAEGRPVAASGSIPAHNELDLIYWNGTTSVTVPTPTEWYQAALYPSPTVSFFSDDDKVVVSRTVADPAAGTRIEHYLVDLATRRFSLVGGPAVPASFTSLASESGRLLAQSFQITPDGALVPFASQAVRTTIPNEEVRFDSFGFQELVAHHISPDGRITFSGINSTAEKVVIQLTPDNDTNGNGISDDYEKEIRLAADVPVETPLDEDVDYDGDGFSLKEERLRGTSDSGTSRPNEDQLYADGDRDGVPDKLDAHPGDSVINWKKGPRPEYIVRPVADTEGNSLQVQFIDLNEQGDVLFKNGDYRVTSEGDSSSEIVETHGEDPGPSHSQYPEFYEVGCEPLGLAANSDTVWGRASFEWREGEYPPGMDPEDYSPEAVTERSDWLLDTTFKTEVPAMAVWANGTGGTRSHEVGASGTDGSFGAGGSQFLLFQYPIFEGHPTFDYEFIDRYEMRWGSDSLDSIEGRPDLTIISLGGWPLHESISYRDSDDYAFSALSHGGAPGSGEYGTGVWNQDTNLQGGWFKDEYLAGRNCYVHIEVEHEDNSVAERDLLFTTAGLRVKGAGGGFDLSFLTLDRGRVKGISKQGWILYDQPLKGGGTAPYIWVNGRTESLGKFLGEGNEDYAIAEVHEMTRDGLICATVIEDQTSQKLALLVPLTVETETSSSSVAANQAPLAPPDFRKISLASGGAARESKPQGQAETDMRGESTSVDAYTRLLRHDMSHVYVPVPTSSDLALQLNTTFSNTPVVLPSTVFDESEETGNYLQNGAYQTKKIRENVERFLAAEVGVFGLGWHSGLDCRVIMKPRSRKPNEGEVLPNTPLDLAVPDEKRIFTHYDVTVTDDNGGTYEFTTSNLSTFAPKPRLVPEVGDSSVSLVRETIDGVDRLVLTKKHGTRLVFAWGVVPPNPLPPRSFTSNPVDDIYAAGPLSVTDRHGNRLIFGGNSIYVEGRPNLKMEFTTSRLSGGKGHREFILVTSVKDPLGKVTRFNYGWTNVLGGMIPILASAVKEDGSAVNYGYESKVGQPVNRTEEFIRDRNSYFENLTYEMDPNADRLGEDVDTSDPRMQALYYHLNLSRISSGSGSYVIAYEPAKNEDMVKARYELRLTDEKGMLSGPGEFAARADIKAKEYRDAIVEQYGKMKGRKISMVKENEGTSSPLRTGTITFAFPAMGAPDKVTGVGLPGGGSMQIKSREKEIPAPDPETGTSPWVDASFPGDRGYSLDSEGTTLLVTPNITEVKEAGGRELVYEFTDLLTFYPEFDEEQTSPADRERYLENPNEMPIPTAVAYQTLKVKTKPMHLETVPEDDDLWPTATYRFSPAAGLALSETEDYQGNTVSYGHSVLVPPEFTGDRPRFSYLAGSNLYETLGLSHPYPTSEIRSFTGGSIVKVFKYDDLTPLMRSAIDGRGNETVTVVKNGRRMAEMKFAGLAPATGAGDEEAQLAGATNLKAYTKYEYGAGGFPNFLVRTTVKDLGASTDPAWVQDFVTEYVPDAYGRVAETIVDPGGLALTTETTYDLAGNKTSERDPAGNLTEFEYDAVGRLIEVRYPGEDVPTKTIGYDKAGRKVSECDELGNYTFWNYDAAGRPVEVVRDMNDNQAIDNGDLITRTKYNFRGYPVEVTDPNGNTTVTAYDYMNRVSRVTDPAGGVTLFDYSGLNSGSGLQNGPGFQPTKIRDARGFVTEITYDDLYRKVRERKEFRLPSGTTEAQAIANETTWASRTPNDADWTKSEMDYDENGNVVAASTWRTVSSTPVEYESTTTYDALNRPSEVTAGVGTALAHTTETSYASTGQAWKTVAFKGISNLLRETETEYDRVSRPVKAWSPHPDTGLVVKTPPSGGQASACVETHYDANSNVSYVIDARGKRTDFVYDERNRQTEALAPEVTDYSLTPPAAVRPRTFTEYDLAGRVWKVTGPRGDVTENEYDPAGRLVRTTAALGQAIAAITRTTYDANGNVIAVRDANGNFTRNQYDKLNRLTATAVNSTTGQPSADFGSPATGDVVVVNQYDTAGNLVKVADGEASKTFNGSSWTVTETGGHVTAFSYDGLGRKVSQVWDVGSSVAKTLAWEYDALVETASVNARTLRIDKTYDALLRPLTETHQNRPTDNRLYSYQGTATFVPGTTTSSYTSGPGPLVAVWAPNGPLVRKYTEVFYTHDRLDRVKTETSAGETHQYWYDIAGNRNLVTYARTGRSLVSKYDDLGRVSQIIDTANSVSDPATYTAQVGDLSTFYRHDAASSIVGKTLPNGTVATNSYDLRGRLLKTTTRQSGGTLVSEFDYTQPHPDTTYPSGYDTVGNVMRVVESYDGLTGREILNTYDRTYRLGTETDSDLGTAAEKFTAYEYDKANNRIRRDIEQTGQPDLFNIYTFGTPALGYNTNQIYGIGDDNVVPDPSVITDYKAYYVYDADGNRIGRQTDPGSVGYRTNNYTPYDNRNRLMGASTQNSASFTDVTSYVYAYDYRTRRTRNATVGGAQTRISFSGGQSVQEYEGTVSAPPHTEIIRGSDMGGGVGGILYTDTASSAAVFNHYNSRGDVVSQTNTGGGVEWEAKYEAFGTRTQEDGVATGRQRANTKDEDPTGLLNEGMRYRDLEAGVFITRDPAGFVNGPNVYTYVRQNAWTAFDPLGLNAVELSGEGMSDQELLDKLNEDEKGMYTLGEEARDRMNDILEEFGVSDYRDLKGVDVESSRKAYRDALRAVGDAWLEEARKAVAAEKFLESQGKISAPYNHDWTLTKGLGASFHSQELANLNAQILTMPLQDAAIGGLVNKATWVYRAARGGSGTAASGGVAASLEGAFQMGKATRVEDINAMLRAEGVLPEGFSLRFASRNNLVVEGAAGYGGRNVQALGSLRSVGWQPTRGGMAKLSIQRLPDGTIPITLDGRLTRNLDLLRGVVRHEVAEGGYLLPYAGQTMSRQQAFSLGNAAHAAGVRVQGF